MKQIHFIALSVAFVLAGCGKDDKGPAAETAEKGKTSSQIVLSRKQAEAVGISWGEVKPGEINYNLEAKGKVTILANAMSDVTAPFKGIVQQFSAKEGQFVQKGQALLTLRVPEFIEYQKQYVQSVNDLQALQKELDRQEELQRENVGAKKNLQEVQAKIAQSLTQKQTAAAYLKLAEINLTNLENGGEFVTGYTVNAPISGYVSHFPVTVGAAATESTVLAHLNNLDDLHADVFLFEKDVQKVKIGQAVNLTFSDPQIPTVKGKIEYIGKEIDPQTKTVMLHIPFVAPKGVSILPEMFVKAEIGTGSAQALLLPESACVRHEDKYLIFSLKSAKNDSLYFEPLEIEPYGSTDGTMALAELPEAQRTLAIKGAHILYAEYKRSEMEE